MKKILFLGPGGSYSHLIAQRVFPGESYIACNTFSNIVKTILSRKSLIGVLPVENSITSDIHENMDFLFNHDLKIIAEGFLKINLHLIGLKGTRFAEIKTVISHYKALEQCSRFIHRHLLKTEQSPSTAQAASTVLSLNEKDRAAIGSKELLKNKYLTLIKENIGDVKFNISRFVFVTQEKSAIAPPVKNKISFICTIAHRPGTLARFLNALARLGVNLTKIESRPIPGTDWEYHFWIDLELNTTVQPLQTVLHVLSTETTGYRLVGIYEIGKQYE